MISFRCSPRIQAGDAANRWPLWCLTLLYESISTAFYARSRQRSLILFSLDDKAPLKPLQCALSLAAAHLDLVMPLKYQKGDSIMRRVVFVFLAAHIFLLTGRLLGGDKPATGDELTRLKAEYADVLALQGTSKGEILVIARILRANPEMA